MEFGSTDDFMLQQAVAQLTGQPVKRSKSRLEMAQVAGKPDTKADSGKASDAGKSAKPATKGTAPAKPAQPPASAPVGEPLGTPTGKAR